MTMTPPTTLFMIVYAVEGSEFRTVLRRPKPLTDCEELIKIFQMLLPAATFKIMPPPASADGLDNDLDNLRMLLRESQRRNRRYRNILLKLLLKQQHLQSKLVKE